MMDKGEQTAIAELLRPILQAWIYRDERRAAKHARELTFWRSGMLRHLELIAEGNGSKETFKALRRDFNNTSERVNAAMHQLELARGKIADRKIADQIDKVLYDFRFGKSAIRSEIQVILSLGESGEADRARRTCNDIKTLNSELERLSKMIYGN
jgi:hypothetical protein